VAQSGELFAKTAKDTLSGELTTATSSVIKYGQTIEVICVDVPYKNGTTELQCYDKYAPDEQIQFDEFPVEADWSPFNSLNESRPLPGGAPGG